MKLLCLQRKFYAKYELVGEITQRQTSIIHKAKHLESGVIYAAKIIQKEQLWNVSINSKIQNELKIIRTLDSPHCVKLIETYESKQELIIVMEYLQGINLYEKLKLHK